MSIFDLLDYMLFGAVCIVAILLATIGARLYADRNRR